VPPFRFGYRLAACRVPVNLVLTRAPLDIGGCGLWNQWEFAKQLLSLGTFAQWSLQECSFLQTSTKDYVITGIDHSHGPPSQTTSKTDGPSSSFDGQDFSMFDAGFLKPGAPQMHMPMHEGSSASSSNQFPNHLHAHDAASDLDADALFSDGADLGESILADLLEVMSGSDNELEHAEEGTHVFQQSAAGSVTGRTHTSATDILLLASILGERSVSSNVFPNPFQSIYTYKAYKSVLTMISCFSLCKSKHYLQFPLQSQRSFEPYFSLAHWGGVVRFIDKAPSCHPPSVPSFLSLSAVCGGPQTHRAG
jgi:hypothetical protein